MRSAYRVMKFGGSSVGNPTSLVKIIATIARERQVSRLAVVVSAMGDSTDWLIDAMDAAARGDLEAAERLVDRLGDLATSTALMVLREVPSSELALQTTAQIAGAVRQTLAPLRQILLGVSLLRERTAQSLDLVMSFGERLSATVIAMLLRAHELPAFALDARDWTVTDATFGQARVDWDASLAKLLALGQSWPPDSLPICTGFLGATPQGITTTLGRNGSDYTATLLARALQASEVIISTDVAGVMTADPRIVPDAYPVPSLSYLEALELAHYGAKMFHPRTMLPLLISEIPMRIRNTMIPDDPGTLIKTRREDDAAVQGPICVTSLERLALIDVRWRQLEQQVHMGQRVLGALERARVTIWMATQAAHGQAVAVAVPLDQLELAERSIRDELRAELTRGELEAIGHVAPVTLLSLVAERMREATHVAGRFFHTLSGVGVSVLAMAQGQSSRSISCVIPEASTHEAVRTVHAAFNFAHHQVNVLLMGKGVVGGQLIEQLMAQRDTLRADHDVDLRLVGLADSRGVRFDPRGVRFTPPQDATPQDATPQDDEPRDGIEDALERLARLSSPVLVDCTAADGMDDLYRLAFARRIHVVAANKKPLTVPMASREAMMQAARSSSRAYLYETTVGASLPVIETLKNLVRTGDKVLRIEGSFSGTLGYLTNQVMSGQLLSAAVRRARELGYTEPMPQDDLSGLDVARKALILARELGLALELDDLVVEPLVPAPLLEAASLDAFFAALEDYDAEFSAKLAAMKAQGQTLRYLAIIDPNPSQPRVSVGPVAIPASHPATHLRGSEAFVAFTTQRYQGYPLIVQGAGAGGAVTAAGVLADILRVAQQVRGR